MANPTIGMFVGDEEAERRKQWMRDSKSVADTPKAEVAVIHSKVGGSVRSLTEQCGFCGVAPGVPCFEVEFESHDGPLTSEPPSRVWIHQIIEDGFIERQWFKEPSPAPYNRSFEYAHLEPIKRALEKCETRITGETAWHRKSDWNALCDAIRGLADRL